MNRYQDAEFLVLALGKFGSMELSYASDLDLVFLYWGDFDNQEYFSKLVARINILMNQGSSLGPLYSIDLELRPQGKSGPSVSRYEAFVNYHLHESAFWEKQALLRSQAVLGPRLLKKLLQNFIFNLTTHQELTLELLEQMADMRKRIITELAHEDTHHINIKKGRGSLMDIEFMVQAYQLKHAEQFIRARSMNYFDLLDLLVEKDPSEGKVNFLILKEAYIFLRSLESKLQLQLERSIDALSYEDEVWVAVAEEFHLKPGELFDMISRYADEISSSFQEVFKVQE